MPCTVVLSKAWIYFDTYRLSFITVSIIIFCCVDTLVQAVYFHPPLWQQVGKCTTAVPTIPPPPPVNYLDSVVFNTQYIKPCYIHLRFKIWNLSPPQLCWFVVEKTVDQILIHFFRHCIKVNNTIVTTVWYGIGYIYSYVDWFQMRMCVNEKSLPAAEIIYMITI